MSTVRTALLLGALSTFSLALQGQPTTVAGFTPGSFRVTESGAAEYRIPIRVPPGIAGMEPKLALVYNSQAGNGLLGMGWNLEGLSAIARCPRTMAQDGVRGGVNYDWNDRYCLDGQRLVLISGTSYGADGAEYRTERESFSKVISYGVAGNGPVWFKVWTKGGQIVEYGNSGDSRIEAQGKATVRVWAVSKISDTKGNYLTIAYNEDNPNGDYSPNRIDYTANSSGTLPAASVQFAYQGRTDVVPHYEAGSVIRTQSVMSSVKTYVGASLVTDYRLLYEDAGAARRLRMTSLTECDKNNACVPATTFQWYGAVVSGLSLSTYPEFLNNDWFNPSYPNRVRVMDVNGDGKGDLVAMGTGVTYVALNNGNGFDPKVAGPETLWNDWFVSFLPGRVHVMDVNGDGRHDIVATGTGVTYVALSNGSGFNPPVAYPEFLGNEWFNPDFPGRVMVMDVNGDGRNDLVAMGTGVTYVALSNGTSFDPKIQSGQTLWNDWFTRLLPGRVQIIDVNGDGKQDIVATGTGVTYVALSNGTGFDPLIAYPEFLGDEWFNPDLPGRVMAVDVNGDGKADLVAMGTGVTYVALSNGNGFEPKVQGAQVLWNDWFSSSLPGRVNIMDVNGDGKHDIVATGTGVTYVALSNGTGFDPPAAYPEFLYNDWFSSGLPGRVMSIDAKGDGKGDLVAVGTGVTYVGRTSTGIADALSRIASGPGGETVTNISYKPLAEGSVYAKGIDAVYPLRDIQGALPVVSSVSASDGRGGLRNMTYGYEGAKVDVEGRGFLGFRSMSAVDEAGGINFTTRFRQDYPYTGLTESTRRMTVGGAMLNAALNSHGCLDPATGAACTLAVGKRYFTFASGSIEAGNDLNGAVLPVITTATSYDSFGNAQTITVSSPGFSKTTTNTYNNDTVNWLLGRLTKSVVASTSDIPPSAPPAGGGGGGGGNPPSNPPTISIPALMVILQTALED